MIPPALPENASRQRQLTRHKKNFLRKRILRRCGLPTNNPIIDRRICNKHEYEDVVMHSSIQINGEIEKINFKLHLPKAVGRQSTFSVSENKSKGVGADRLLNNIARTFCENTKRANYDNIIHTLSQSSSTSESPSSSSPSSSSSDDQSPTRKYSIPSKAEPISNKREYIFRDEPRCKPSDYSDEEVKRRTGFVSKDDMLLYITILCNGDLTKMRENSSSLTWYEEWFFYFEKKHGKTILRWVDASSKEEYGVGKEILIKVFKSKLTVELTCRASWPEFLSFDEDFHFMRDVYKETYEGKRIVFWDNTNINIAQSSCADFQRATWSSYYAHNCLKGGVFLQLGGWMGTHNLWMGAVSDTEYNGEGKILKQQWEFAKKDLVNGKEIPFTNTTDKGY